MTDSGNLCGFRKARLYGRIAIHVAVHYGMRRRQFGLSVGGYLRFLGRALRLLLMLRHSKVVRVAAHSYKLHLYVPAYPGDAFFHTLEAKLLRQPPGPTTVVLSMTRACRYHCRHCYQRHDGGRDLDETLLLATAQQMQELGVAMFDIEGGEPLRRPDRLLNLIRALDRRAEVWVNTTGDGLTPELLAELRCAGLFGVMVSVHSPDPARHDAFTGVDGSFAVAVETLRQFRRAGMATAVNSVLSESEVRRGRLGELMELARQLDCAYVQLIHPKPAGQWLEQHEQMQTDPAIIAQLRAEHRRYNSAARRQFPALAAQVSEEAPGALGCTAGGIDRFYLNAHGEVQPCEFLNISFGNVNEEPFAQIFARMRAAFPHACTDWLCCTQSAAIAALCEKHQLAETPVRWEHARELVQNWDRGRATPFYRKLGIYR